MITTNNNTSTAVSVIGNSLPAMRDLQPVILKDGAGKVMLAESLNETMALTGKSGNVRPFAALNMLKKVVSKDDKKSLQTVFDKGMLEMGKKRSEELRDKVISGEIIFNGIRSNGLGLTAAYRFPLSTAKKATRCDKAIAIDAGVEVLMATGMNRDKAIEKSTAAVEIQIQKRNASK